MSRTYNHAPYRVKVARAGTAAITVHHCHGRDACDAVPDGGFSWRNRPCWTDLPPHVGGYRYCCSGQTKSGRRLLRKSERAAERQQLIRLARAANHEGDFDDDRRTAWPRRNRNLHWWC